jgi:hypothetical protein
VQTIQRKKRAKEREETTGLGVATARGATKRSDQCVLLRGIDQAGRRVDGKTRGAAATAATAAVRA